MERYSMFGIAFQKNFLIQFGASPVFYVARDATVLSTNNDQDDRSLGDVFDELWERTLEAQLKLMPSQDGVPRDSTGRPFYMTFTELVIHVFSFVKGFDASESHESEGNLYTEREWRMVHNLQFDIPDVYRIIIPETYAARFRNEVPEYTGQLTFAETVQPR